MCYNYNRNSCVAVAMAVIMTVVLDRVLDMAMDMALTLAVGTVLDITVFGVMDTGLAMTVCCGYQLFFYRRYYSPG